MRIYRFDAEAGRRIDTFGSINVVLTRIVRLTSETHVRCFHLGPHGRVGYHQAVTPQLFLAVQGEGWVRGEADERIPLRVGYAAFWEKSEWHESGTDVGLMSIVMEGEALHPDEFMALAE